MDLKDFKNPSKSFRPSPFWSWNDTLDPEELRWQVREFADKGFGGYFMHSRVGLTTPYLSPEWMKCVRACLDEGRKVGTESWLYDEDKWPSGFAGGFVPAKGDEYRARSITMKEVKLTEVTQALADHTTLGVYDIEFSLPMSMKGFRRISKPQEIKAGGRLFQFKVEVSSRNNWYNGESYVDLLNPNVTNEFLKVTVDAYAEEFRKDFGEYMPGIFTDEPNYVGRNVLPWTVEMVEYFYKVNSYDILDKLPLLYFEGKDYHKVRYDFWKTVTLRFIEAFSKPYGDKCAEKGLMMTGHYLCEDNLDIQTRYIGAAMPHYEYMQALGIDHLSRNINDPLTLKQCSSVAHQFNRLRVLSELFGCSGHSMSFEDQKWIGDFHLVLGITFFCPHLTLYTMKGDAKRDYPPTLSYHQPYWKHFNIINNYFARGSYLCSQGRFQTDILVLHSIGCAWATFTPLIDAKNKDTQTWKYNDALVKLQDDLLALHRDFDYGDEIILSRHGHIEGNEFVVIEGRYKIVIIPPSLTWSAKTVELLKRFLDAGGKALFVGETPSLINGESGESEWSGILAHPNVIRTSPERVAVSKALDKVLSRSISVADETGNEIENILINHRVDGDLHVYFLANKSRTEKYNAVLMFQEIGEVTIWDLFTGLVFPAYAALKQGKTVINTEFQPTGSLAILIDTSKPLKRKRLLLAKEAMEETSVLVSKWSFERLHPNSIVLDACEYYFEGGKWNPKIPIWKIRREAWKEAGLDQYSGIQPWVLMTKNIKPLKKFEIRLRTTFKSEVNGKKVFLVLEKSPTWKLVVNGKLIPTNVKEWHWDKQFGKIDISEFIKVGENQIDVFCKYGLDLPIEDMYLVGDFGVKKLSDTEYVLTDEPDFLSNGEWGKQMYPFYAGTMRYKTTINFKKETEAKQNVLVRLPSAKGTLFLISVNDKEPVPVCWEPLEADITDLVQDGTNELTIDVVSSLRNSFGPLHHKGGELYSVGPYTFTDESNWVDAYQLVPYGLIKGAEIIIRKEKLKETTDIVTE